MWLVSVSMWAAVALILRPTVRQSQMHAMFLTWGWVAFYWRKKNNNSKYIHLIYTQSEKCFFHQAELGYNMTLLDIGGGFPGSEDTKLKFEEVLLFFHIYIYIHVYKSQSSLCVIKDVQMINTCLFLVDRSLLWLTLHWINTSLLTLAWG